MNPRDKDLDRLLKNAALAARNNEQEMPARTQARVLSSLRAQTPSEEFSLIPLLWKSLAAVCVITMVVVAISLMKSGPDVPEEIDSVNAAINFASNL